MTVVLKHATSSVFLFTATNAHGWQVGLIRHPRLGRWMLPGGHVEAHENPAEAALREVSEETGLHAQLICPPSIGVPDTPAGSAVPVPLWIVEQQVPAEPRHPQPHVHVDYLYLAVVAQPKSPQTAELPFTWYDVNALNSLHMFPDSRSCARLLFQRIGELTDSLTGSTLACPGDGALHA